MKSDYSRYGVAALLGLVISIAVNWAISSVFMPFKGNEIGKYAIFWIGQTIAAFLAARGGAPSLGVRLALHGAVASVAIGVAVITGALVAGLGSVAIASIPTISFPRQVYPFLYAGITIVVFLPVFLGLVWLSWRWLIRKTAMSNSNQVDSF